MKHICFIFMLMVAGTAMLPMAACNPEDHNTSSPIDTLPDSEWWECDSINDIPIGGRNLLLNISWNNGLLRTYTDIQENPFSLDDGEPVRFNIVNDTMYYLDLAQYYPNNLDVPIWHITQHSDSSMAFLRCGGLVMHGMNLHLFHFTKR